MADNKPPRDDALALSLACWATVEAARQAGVSDRTVYRRLKDATFQKRIKEARTDLVRRSAGLLSAASGEAVRTPLALMKDSTGCGRPSRPCRRRTDPDPLLHRRSRGARADAPRPAAV
jgi:hypothetical protein